MTFTDGISALTCKPHAKNLIAVQLNIYIALYHFQSFLVSIVQANLTVSCAWDTRLLCPAAAGEVRHCLF